MAWRKARFVVAKCKLALVVAVVIASVFTSVHTAIASADTGTWVDGAQPTLTIGDTITNAKMPVSCFPSSITYSSFTNASYGYSSIPRDITQAVCMRTNSIGKYASPLYTDPSQQLYEPYGYEFAVPGNGFAYRVVDGSGTSQGIIPVPSQPTFMVVTPDAYYGGGRYMYFYDNLAAVGTYEPTYVRASNSTEIALKLRAPLGGQLKDSLGRALSLRDTHYAFSNNGQWMIAEIDGVGIVRINTQTRQIHLVDAGYKPRYGLGYTPITFLAISDDGSSALRSSDGAVVGYDLANCTATSFAISATTNAATGCRQRNLYESLAQQAPSLVSLHHLRFTDTKQIAGIVTRTTGVLPTGIPINSSWQMKLTVAGYTPSTGGYIALGDSFSSGEGAQTVASDTYPRGYEKGTDENNPENLCHVSPISYPYLAASTLQIDNFHSVACSGAKYDDDFINAQFTRGTNPVDDWVPGFQPQSQYLVGKSPDTITLSMFGNDIGFSDIIKLCLLAPDTCYAFKEDRQKVAQEISSQFDSMVDMYRSVKGTDTTRKVYILGYPKLFGNQSCGVNTSFDADERQFATGLVEYLNATIKAATEKAGVQYIDVENAFAGHELCGGVEHKDTAVNGLTAGNGLSAWLIKHIGPVGQESFHPNQLGHQLMATALMAQSNNFTNPMPAPNHGKAAPGTNHNAYYDLLGTAPTGGSNALRRTIYYGGELADIVYSNTLVTLVDRGSDALKPSTLIEVWINSTPTHIGDLTVDADGHFNGTITVPANITPGYHTLHLYGKDLGGKDVDIHKVIYVAASENDLDGDGTPNDQEKCLLGEPANLDEDNDGVDDACDGQITVPPVPTDATAPVVTGTPDRIANANGWYNNDVTIAWAANDAEPSSGAPSMPASTAASQEGMHTYSSGQSCDPANNCATGTIDIKLDKTQPVITHTFSHAANDHDWHNQAVTIGFTCQDPLADQADPTSASGIAICPEPITVQYDSSNQTITATATDNAGNQTTTTITINLDTTAPDITYHTVSKPNASDWYNGPVTVTFDCQDTGSGINTCTPPITISQDGGSIVTATATDNAGNTQSVNVFVLIDKTLPAISAQQSPAANYFGWNNTDVSINFACNDALSGIVQCNAPLTLTEEGTNLAASGTTTDTAGNSATAAIANIKIDKTAPEVTATSLSMPAKSTAATSTFSATLADALSGIYQAEYFIGSTDPDEGKGATMPIAPASDGHSATASVVLGTDFPTGVYKLSVRTRDYAGNWSAPVSDYLVVYSNDGARLTGRKTLQPSISDGDVLPGLIAAIQQNKATFGFNVYYDRMGNLSRNSDFQFSYTPQNPGCRHSHEHGHKSRQMPPCPSIELNATVIDWLSIDASNPHVATFQGTARQDINGVTSYVPFRVVANDGIRHDSSSPDHLQVLVFAPDANPFTATPVYHVDADVLRGNIRLR